ncbi:trypsin-like peptidase domain-containing protein [bacterium]|nr:trypsin-like peptidase domain-containing protein [bacterium]
MPLVHCPTCHRQFPADSRYLGRGVTCPLCHHPLIVAGFVPEPAPPPPDSDSGYQPTRQAPVRPGFFHSWSFVYCSATLFVVVVQVGGLLVWIKLNMWAEQDRQAANKATTKETDRTNRKEAVATPAAAQEGRMDDTTVSKIKAATVYIRVESLTRTWSGSGFFVGPGLVMTNHHVVDHPGQLEVVINSGTRSASTRSAGIVRYDKVRDLALLDVGGGVGGLPAPIPLHPSSSLRETHDVYIFGFPFGERLGQEISVAKSSVSSFRTRDGVREVQVNGGMHSGNSGGPVTDSAGRVIGVAVAVITNSQINFAIAGEEAQQFLAEYRRRR